MCFTVFNFSQNFRNYNIRHGCGYGLVICVEGMFVSLV